MSSRKTIILGFDALSFDYLDRFDLPHFDAVRSDGIETTLESTFPPWTGSAWPSLYTGVDPDHHGVYSFFDFQRTYPDEASVITRNHVRSPAIWNYLSARDVPSVVFNVPVTHPAEPIDGTIVPGYLAPEETDGYPELIREDISTAIGEKYRIYAPNEGDSEIDVTVDEFVSLIDHRRRAAVEVLERSDWELAIVQVQKTDTVFHKFQDESSFERVYQAADALLGSILETVDDANILVCSDHGIGRTDGYNIYINEILRRHGFVEATTNGDTPTLGETKTELTNNERTPDSGGARARSVAAVETMLSTVNVTPGDVYSVAQRLNVENAVQRMLPDGAIAGIGEHVDWRRSMAYCRSGPELGVRINLDGREPAGVVSESAYDRVRDELIEILSELRTPDGELAFEWVKPREAVYDGPHAEAACDVLFMPAKMNNLVATNLLGTEFVPIDKYNHKSEGVFIGAGPGFADGSLAEPLSITDVAPIAMALLGQPVPEGMTGTVPDELVRRSTERSHYIDVKYGTETDPGADDEVVNRLESLGYVE